MEDNKLTYSKLIDAISSAFIDDSGASSSLTPSFLYNDSFKRKKVINDIVKNLRTAEEFSISVAFITMSGLQLLKGVFEELLAKGIKGRILTTDYLCFTEPDALLFIKEYLPNIEVRMYKTENSKIGFHTKGYLIKQKGIYKLIIGSSNITDAALTVNKEWNTELVSTEEGGFVKDVLDEFNSLWEKATKLDEYIDTYKKIYIENKRYVANKTASGQIKIEEIKPNQMQIEFVNCFLKIIENQKRGLLISSTGTGKTYASAFALKEAKAKKILFLVHRSQLLLQAIRSYRVVFGENLKINILSGDSRIDKELDNVEFYKKGNDFDILFSTCFMAKKKLEDFDRNEFDFIVIDEVHRAGSDTYQEILNYFEPRFTFGMTATPERTGDESLIFDMFDNNIIFEIRLQDALDFNLLCPFHYYGITDIKGIDDNVYKLEDFNRLYSEERINYILQKSKYYAYSGERLRGLVFASRRKDGEILEQKFNEKGYKAKFISGNTSASERERYIALLEKQNIDDGEYLDFLITVDIFNEGVDIPEVNQVIMLRPTESSIIFIQQLGRGLRKWKNKDFVVVLDFIGNYDNNYMIPKAFSRGGSKEEAKMIVTSSYLPGISTIEFDEIARGKVLSSITKTDFNSYEALKSEYIHLKNKINRIPSLNDFLDYTSFDPYRIISKFKSYQRFLLRMESDLLIDENDLKYFDLLSKILGKGIRKTEAIYLKTLQNSGNILDFIKEYNISNECIVTLTNEFKNDFSTGVLKNGIEIISDFYNLSESYKKLLSNPIYKEMIDNLIKFSIRRSELFFFNNNPNSLFSLSSLYSREDVSIILNLSQSRSSTLYGYQYLQDVNTFPIFVNYQKEDDIDESINYDDHFVDKNTFVWNARDGEKLTSKNIIALLNAKENNTKILLFVRKSTKEKGDSSLHYYLGELELVSCKDIKRNGKNNVHAVFKLKNEVRQDIYNYLESNIEKIEEGV